MKREAFESLRPPPRPSPWKGEGEGGGAVAAPENIAVLRALRLGDMLCAVPALRALRAAHPLARVTLIGLPWAREFAQRYSRYVDDFLEFPGFPGLPERDCDPRAFTAFLADAQDRRFDLALQLHGDGRVTNAIAALLGARHCAGFFPRGGDCPDASRFLPWEPREHEVLRPLRLLERLGVPGAGIELELALDEIDKGELARLAQAFRFRPGQYVCVHPGAQLASRRWGPERFARVADALAAEGHAIVLTGTAGEAAVTCAVADAMRARAIDLTGRTTLGALAALVAKARLLVCNDTAVSHIAAATKTPSVVVSCGADTARWSPLDPARHRVLAYELVCRPCGHAACPYGHECAQGVPTDAVLAEARALLERFPTGSRHAGAPRDALAEPG
jgi:ADP-heptose:LPS heptosyltransferase